MSKHLYLRDGDPLPKNIITIRVFGWTLLLGFGRPHNPATPTRIKENER